MSDFIDDFLAFTDGIASPERFRLWAGISAVAGACERRIWLETTVGVLYANLFVLLVAPPAVGKCLHPDEKVLMFDGSVKRTGDLCVGDKLVGPDGTDRTVLWVAPGRGKMYKIIPKKGRSWKCNGEHILSLRKSREPNRGIISHVTVEEWLTWAPSRKTEWKLWKSGPVNFELTHTSTLSPYFIGVMLGDGSRPTDSIAITTADPEIVEAIKETATAEALNFVQRKGKINNAANLYAITSDITGENKLLTEIRNLGLNVACGNKFVPPQYKYGTQEERAQILAGLMDTDGYLYKASMVYEFVSKSKKLAADVVFMARSLGLRAQMNSTMKSAGPGHLAQYWSVVIGGEIARIPCRIARKKAETYKPGKLNNDGFDIYPLQEDDWFGITVDKDNQYLLDDFTVIHNSLALTPVRKLWREVKDLHVAPNSVTKAGLLDELAKAKTTRLIDGGKDLFEYNCMLIASSEFGVLCPAHDTEFLSVLIDLYDNPSEFRESRRDKTRCVDIINPMLNIIAGTQPGFLAGMLPEEAWSMGFMSRNIMVYAGSGPQLNLFDFSKRDTAKWPSLVKQLEEVKALIGRMEFEPEYMESVQAWLNSGQQPVPEHSKLQHYNGRRLMSALKLSIISAVSARKELTLKLSDWERALGWLLEAEVHMPDVFREMSNRSDGQVIQELHFYMWKWYVSHKKEPMHENMLINFLSNRAPSEKILKIIEIASRSNIIQQLEGTKLYIPKAKTEHGGE